MEKNQDKGFTLVELLIVIVILGILATVTVFAVRGITDKGQDNACGVEARTLDTAVEAYYANTQTDALAVTDLVPTYLKDLPNATNWLFVAKTQAIPAGLGQDGVAGGTGVNADRAAVAAGAGQTNVGFYSLDAGKCGGF